MKNIFDFFGKKNIITPQLVINRQYLENNIDKTIHMSKDAERLWPHIKTHKSADIIKLMVAHGITKFKCATIAECEIAAESGATKVLLAYPVVGPNTMRLLNLIKAFPSVEFFGAFDDFLQLQKFNEECKKENIKAHILMDINVGLDRTGIKPSEVTAFYNKAKMLTHVSMDGLHCYDGQRHESDLDTRCKECDKTYALVHGITAEIPCKYVIMGGTPSFPCYIKYKEIYLSPGTLFINDAGYSRSYPDLNFPPAAAVLTRVVSNPCEGRFTLDLGYKGIASDPSDPRGVIIGIDDAKPIFQNEEHWVWQMNKGCELLCPKVGDELFVIPTHICPTSALYPYALVVEDGKLVAQWTISARNRKITY